MLDGAHGGQILCLSVPSLPLADVIVEVGFKNNKNRTMYVLLV